MKSDTSEEFERFKNFVRGIINVPGAEVKREIEAEKEAKERKKKRAKTSPVSRASNDRER